MIGLARVERCWPALLLFAPAVVPALAAQAQSLGEPAPDFALESLEGRRTSLAEFRGRPVLVNFWASWCGPCRTELPAIVAAYDSNRATGLQVLLVNLRDQERERDVRRFVEEFRLPFPVLLDVRGRVRRSYALRGVPTTVFIDTAGVVRMVHPGPLDSAALKDGLAAILPAPGGRGRAGTQP